MKIVVGDTELVEFKQAHTDALFKLVNDSSIRQGMRNKQNIPYQDHLKWVSKNLLANKTTHLFMTYQDVHPIAVTLLKNLNNGSGELGIMVKDARQSRNSLLVSKLICGILHYAYKDLKLDSLVMNIILDNKDSYNLARKIGAVDQYQNDTYLNFKLTKEKYLFLYLHQAMNRRFQPMVVQTTVKEIAGSGLEC